MDSPYFDRDAQSNKSAFYYQRYIKPQRNQCTTHTPPLDDEILKPEVSLYKKLRAISKNANSKNSE
jgi:hypothetical protein